MHNNLKYRKAKIEDLSDIVDLLVEDDLGKNRENKEKNLNKQYIEAFHEINKDKNQYLMVIDFEHKIIATCHLTIIPSLTFIGSKRLQIEAVRVMKQYRNQKIGSWMINQVINYAKQQNVSIIQLTTNKQRLQAKNFYEKIGFKSSHEGMKLYL